MGGLDRVTRAEPCAICGKCDYCARLDLYHWCMRVESLKPHPKGGWLHLREGAIAKQVRDTPRPPRISDAEMRDRWTPIALESAASGKSKLPELSAELGVDTRALELLQVGYSNLDGSACWTWPEKNSRGWIIGIVRRLAVPMEGCGKLCAKGSRRGLTYRDDWSDAPGVIWLVEGGSDTAAGLSLGLCVVGRPNNLGGIDLLTALLKTHRRRIIVMGEHDYKGTLPDSKPPHDPKCRCCIRCFPGGAGAKQTARELSKRLKRQIGWAMPPPGYKDLRAYLNSIPIDQWRYRGVQLQAGRFPTATRTSGRDDP